MLYNECITSAKEDQLWKELNSMGMTDHQFNTFQVHLLERLKNALKCSPENEELKKIITDIEKSLLRL